MINGRFFSYFNTAEQIINNYNGSNPFSEYLKSFFRTNRKAGSKDRKSIASLCYAYFRMGKALMHLPVRERILAGYFLCTNEETELLSALALEWNASALKSVNSKISIIREKYPEFSLESIFPFLDETSNGLDHKAFLLTLLRQPDVFIRIRPGHVNSIHRKLKRADINYTALDEYAVKIPANTVLDKIADLQTEMVVQDYSSQKTADFFPPADAFPGAVRIWDCCAASGGKSILAADQYDNIQLTVSDNRESILKNLELRFKDSGIKEFLSYVADLSKPIPAGTKAAEIPKNYFDLIIADVPCSGSGTWARSPERMKFLQSADIKEFSELQFRIAGNVIHYLRENGYFLYITCSVYKEENENVVERLEQEFNLRIIKTGLIPGASVGADTLFATLFTSAV